MRTTTAAALALDGIGIVVEAADSDVRAALELRLRGLGGPAGDAVRLVFGREPPAPRSPGREVYATPHGALAYHPEEDLLAGRFGAVALACNAGAGIALIGAPSFCSESLYLATHPLATVALMELFERRGRFSLHAACLADSASGAGVLVAGTSGAGKSTLTLALARGGLAFLSDDTVFLSDGRVAGFSDALGLTPYAATCFPELRPLLDQPPEAGFPKRLHRIEELWDVPVRPDAVPRALVFPRLDPAKRPSVLRPLDGGEALLRLVPDVLLTDPAATQLHLSAIAEMLESVEVYDLRFGPDLERAADLVAGLVR